MQQLCVLSCHDVSARTTDCYERSVSTAAQKKHSRLQVLAARWENWTPTGSFRTVLIKGIKDNNMNIYIYILILIINKLLIYLSISSSYHL